MAAYPKTKHYLYLDNYPNRSSEAHRLHFHVFLLGNHFSKVQNTLLPPSMIRTVSL